MKTWSFVSLLAVSITTCSATSSQQQCNQLNKLVTVAKLQQQAKSFCEAFIPGTTVTTTSLTTTTAIVAGPTPTTEVIETSTVTPAASTETRDLCIPSVTVTIIGGTTLQKRSLETNLPQPHGRSLVQESDAALEPRDPKQNAVNYNILGTSRDKRPAVWRLFAANALIQACNCLQYGGTTSTTTTVSTLTSTSTSAQTTTATTTTTTTVTAPTPTVTETTNFRLTTSNSNTLYIRSGDASWFYQSPATGFQLYKLRDTTLVANSGDQLQGVADGSYALFLTGGRPEDLLRCSLTATLELQCLPATSDGTGDARVYFYETETRISLSTEQSGDAVTIQAVPDGCS